MEISPINANTKKNYHFPRRYLHSTLMMARLRRGAHLPHRYYTIQVEYRERCRCTRII